jgi:hypothetical protein
MPSASLSIEQILAILSETPWRLAELSAGLTPTQLRTPPGPGVWSANDILAHLRSCADMWDAAIETIIARDHPTLRAINPTAWITQTDYPDLEFADSLRAFTTQRAKLLALLGPLPREGWARSATVTGAGAPLQRTVLNYGNRMAGHERSHITPFARLVRTLRR